MFSFFILKIKNFAQRFVALCVTLLGDCTNRCIRLAVRWCVALWQEIPTGVVVDDSAIGTLAWNWGGSNVKDRSQIRAKLASCFICFNRSPIFQTSPIRVSRYPGVSADDSKWDAGKFLSHLSSVQCKNDYSAKSSWLR